MFENKKLSWVLLLVLLGPLFTFLPFYSQTAGAYHQEPTGASTNDSGETVVVTFPDETVTFGDLNTAPAGVYKGTIAGNACESHLELDSANATAVLTVREGDGDNCSNHATINLDVSGETPDPTDPGSGVTQEEQPPSCEDQGALSWLACPLTNFMLNAVKATADFISTFLAVQPLTQDSAAFEVWSNLRNIALGLFVIAVIIVIFGQSMSLDAYTVKRMAPRLGVAAIAIMLSFYVAAFMIDMFNVMGSSLYALLTNALGGVDVTMSAGGIAANYLGGTALLAGGVIGIVSQGAFAFFVMILVPILLAFITGFVVILARQVILIMMVVVSPIAMAAWVLPNTEQYFKKWWGLFTALLMMYPIIMLLLAGGTIFATIVTNGEGTITESNFLNHIIALLALAVTVGMIPLTLRASSSLLGRIANVANNPNRGPIDRLRKAGQGRADHLRDTRRQNRLRELGQIESGDRPGSRIRRGWLRGTTGTFGYRHGGLQQSESISESLSAEERQQRADFKTERIPLEQRKIELEGDNIPIRMAELEDSQRNFEVEAVVKRHARENTGFGQLESIAQDESQPQIERLGATMRLLQTRQYDRLGNALSGLAATGNGSLAAEAVNRDYGTFNEFAPEYTGYVRVRRDGDDNITGPGAPAPDATAGRPTHQIGLVAPEGMRNLVNSNRADYIQTTARSYIEADEKNQPTNALAAAHLSQYADSHPTYFSEEERESLGRIARRPEDGWGASSGPIGPPDPGPSGRGTPPAPASPAPPTSSTGGGGTGGGTPSSPASPSPAPAPQSTLSTPSASSPVPRAESYGTAAESQPSEEQRQESAKRLRSSRRGVEGSRRDEDPAPRIGETFNPGDNDDGNEG